MNFSVTQFGKPLSEDKYTWDAETKTFSTTEDYLVLDFSKLTKCTFNTGSWCIFITGGWCNFNTGSWCTFNTNSNCTFNTGDYCTFNIFDSCILKVGKNCVVVRKDLFEVIQIPTLPEHKKIEINEPGERGYKTIDDLKIITIDGEDIKISYTIFENIMKLLEQQ